MRFRITIRGEGIELRGYVDGDLTDMEALARMCDPWVVMASPAPDNYDPFAISEPENPPTLEKSLEVITGIWDNATSPEPQAALAEIAMIHYGQAMVIRGERALRERAEAELAGRELHHFETEQMLDQVVGYLKRHKTDDGWTGDVDEILGFLGRTNA